MLTISGDPLLAEPVLEEELIARPLTPMERYGIGWEEVAIHFAVTHDLLSEETASIEDEADIVVGLEAIRDHLREDGPEVGYGLLRDQLFSAAAHGLDFVGPVPVGTEEEMAIGTAEAAASGSTCGSSPRSTPAAVDDLYIAGKDHVLSIPPDGVLTNDCEALGLPNTSHLYNGLTTEHGTLNLQTNGSFTFTPNTGYTGWDSFYYRAYGNGRWSNMAFVEIAVIGVDIDIDSDNNGLLERSTTEDNMEMQVPGKILVTSNPQQPRQPFKIALEGGGGLTSDELAGYYVTVESQSMNISVFDSLTSVNWPQPQGAYSVLTAPKTFYVQGNTPGVAQIDLVLRDLYGNERHRDQIKLTVVNAGVTAFRPQNNFSGYGAPFQRTAIQYSEQVNPGVGIRRNWDDDNENAQRDFLENTSVSYEDDLIELEIGTSQTPGVQYRIARSNTKLDIWTSRLRGGPSSRVLGGTTATSAALTYNGGFSLWAEWTDRQPALPDTVFTLEVRAANNNNLVYSEPVRFVPFTSMVVVLGGEFQIPGDPVQHPGDHGLFQTAIDLYREGYNVYMYDEDDVSYTLGATPPELGSGIVFDTVGKAINDSGISKVAILGYSHGGGATYDLSWRLANDPENQIINPFQVVLTEYVDAVRRQGSTFNPLSETRKPIATLLHVSQYQSVDNLRGAPSGATPDLDVTYLGVNHGSIDDHPTVLNRIKNDVRTNVPK